jgi:folate-dependent phosphoribosylglycinamide formyltransferase PurN
VKKKSIEIIVLFNGSTLARIYLALLKKNNFEPKKILHINYAAGSGRKFKILSRFFGGSTAKIILNFYNKFKNRHENSYNIISEKLLNIFQLSSQDLLDENILNSNYYEKIQLTNVDDPALTHYLRNQEFKIVLYTGGWILKKPILEDSGCKFIHIHPGIVPDIKGADCVLWSYLLKGKLGYTCFYMKPEIDTGDILHRREYVFDVDNSVFKSISDDNIYNLITRYYDPCLRILTFIDLLNGSGSVRVKTNTTANLENFATIKQNPEAGRTYFFMHPKLKNKVIQLMMNKKKPSFLPQNI